mgnify:FL=1
MTPDAYLALHLRLVEMRDKIQHPAFLTFQSKIVDVKPTFKLNSSKTSLVWTITFRKEKRGGNK